MDEKTIISIIESTLNKKQNVNCNYISYTFYEIRVKYDLSEKDTEKFLALLKTKLENQQYNVYFTGAKYTYKGERKVVENNQLIVAIKG